MADQRLPISLAFMVIACAHLNLRHHYVRRGFATVLVLLLAIRVFEVQTVWARSLAVDQLVPRIGPAHRPRLQGAGRLRRSRRRRRRARPRPRACRLPRHHRAIGAGDHRPSPSSASRSSTCGRSIATRSTPRTARRRRSRQLVAGRGRSRRSEERLLEAVDLRLRLSLRAVHRSQLRKSRSGAADRRSMPASGSCSTRSTRRMAEAEAAAPGIDAAASCGSCPPLRK